MHNSIHYMTQYNCKIYSKNEKDQTVLSIPINGIMLLDNKGNVIKIYNEKEANILKSDPQELYKTWEKLRMTQDYILPMATPQDRRPGGG